MSRKFDRATVTRRVIAICNEWRHSAGYGSISIDEATELKRIFWIWDDVQRYGLLLDTEESFDLEIEWEAAASWQTVSDVVDAVVE